MNTYLKCVLYTLVTTSVTDLQAARVRFKMENTTVYTSIVCSVKNKFSILPGYDIIGIENNSNLD